MSHDPYGRPSWEATPPAWPAQPPPPYTEGQYAPGPYPPDAAETVQYPGPPGSRPPGAQPSGMQPPDTRPPGAPPYAGFAWRDGPGPPPPPPRRPVSGLLIALLAIAALLAAGIVAYLLVPRLTSTATPEPTATPAPTAAEAAPVATPSAQPSALTITAVADCVSAPSRDAAGAVVDYGPPRMVDGRTDTAWRCDGDGAGKTIKVTFSSPAKIVGVGMIPGYAKTDPADGTDRYAQNRRIAQVRYTFDDGTTVEQSLTTDAGDRSTQTVAVPGVTSSGMTVSIVRSVPGTGSGANRASDRIAISELTVLSGG